MEVYFDNSATTKINDEVLKCINNSYEKFYANPSSMHKLGFLTEMEIKNSNQIIANILNSTLDEIIWTSGGSESNNLAIKGIVNANIKNGNHIITTKIEHPSVLKVFEFYEKKGFDVTYLSVNKYGRINIDELVSNIKKETLLVSIMHTNNEIGSIQDIYTIGNKIKEINNKTFFHVDFVQGFGKYKLDVKKSKIDLLSLSAHKFNGPKGIGILYKDSKVRIIPEIIGGEQQNNLRAGTLNAPNIIATALSAKIAYENLSYKYSYLLNLKKYFCDKINILNEKFNNIISFNSLCNDEFAPHIISISVRNIKAEVLLHALEEYNIYVSAGSACSSHNKKISNTLKAIELDNSLIDSTIRISFSINNTKNEVDYFIENFEHLVPKLLIKY